MKLDTKDYEVKMQKAIASYQENLSSIRAGQANAAILNKVTFEYWGTPTLIKDMAAIMATDSRTLTVTPYDATVIKAMEKAILVSDIGITPSNDGKVIRLVFPQLTEDRRKELAKQVQQAGEDAKVAIRNVRRDANDMCKKMKKDGEMTEDEQKASEKTVQDLTDKYIKEVDAVTSKKKDEIMKI